MNAAWQPLVTEFDRLAEAGRTMSFWLRDDDAVEPTAALDDFLNLTQRNHIPLTLAVIPEHTGEALARRLDSAAGVSVAVHGWSHRNYAPVTEKKQELGAHRPAVEVLGELGKGFAKLHDLHGSRFVPLLVPPWNRIDPALLGQLPGLSFRAVSTYGQEMEGPIRAINTHVDVIDWHGTGGGKPTEKLVADMIKRVKEIEDDESVVGILTHHLVHDEQGRAFLGELFDVTNAHTACQWIDIRDRLGSK
jgi:peptidoglycan/xylan/chitin deacetylase (PgdA/CDA1 family)